MVIVSVLYPKKEQLHFDYDYYLKTHVPLVRIRFDACGLKELRLMRGTATLDGAPAKFEVIAQLVFSSTEEMQHALTAHGEEIIGDIPNFTNAEPLLQINEPL